MSFISFKIVFTFPFSIDSTYPLRKNFTKTPDKRISSEPDLPAKKLCEEIKSELDKESIEEDDLKRIRERISSKKKKLEHVKQQLLYEKKHESKDLENLTERWLRGCQEALSQFQKDISRNTGADFKMTEILRQLGIPAELVKYSEAECDFV